jgi:hypothetical protein
MQTLGAQLGAIALYILHFMPEKTIVPLLDRDFNMHPKEAVSANLLSAPSASMDSDLAALSQKTLPEFQGISQWLDTHPLAIANLQRQGVLVQFWTFSCINCQQTLFYSVRLQKLPISWFAEVLTLDDLNGNPE